MNDEMLEEFFNEAFELFEEAEEALLKIDKGEEFNPNFNSLFRAFHSVKGGAGMFELNDLQEHMHYLENLIEKKKEVGSFTKALIDYLLKGNDIGKSYLETREIEFDYYDPDSNDSDKAKHIDSPHIDKVKVKHQKKDVKSKLPLVYLVDDEEEILEYLEMIVSSQDYRVKTFTDGNVLFENIKEDKPDLIISDMKMPKISGLQIMKNVRKMMPHLPFIMCSGFVTKDLCIESLSHGIQGIIEKPYDQNQLLSMVKSNITRYQAFKLMNRSLDLLVYQFSEFDKYLEQKGDSNVRAYIRDELKIILENKKKIMTS